MKANEKVHLMDYDELRQEISNQKNTVVLVEGPNDKRSLEKLDFQNIYTLNKPLYQIVEELENEEELLILTDLDEHGKELYKYFYTELTKRGVRINNRLRIMISQTPVRHIEGLAHHLEKNDSTR